jgi:UDP-N-acetylglucosamine acyltransferase
LKLKIPTSFPVPRFSLRTGPVTAAVTKMPRISSLAVVDPRATLADDVEVGPFCVVGPDVTIGPGCKLISHVVITGHTTVGRNNTFYANCVIGTPPQDLKYRGEPTCVEIGDGNTFREAVSINIGTVQGGKVCGGGVTRIGDNNLLMINSHVGHDVQMGSRCIIANNVMFAGHIIVGNNVVIGGAAGVNAFVTIGDYVFVAGAAQVHLDAPPFMKLSDRDKIRGLNVVGLRRAGFSEADIQALDEVARKLFLSKEKPFAQTLAEYASLNGENLHIKHLIDFLRRRDQGQHGRYLERLRS